jgi:hypothetical protein
MFLFSYFLLSPLQLFQLQVKFLVEQPWEQYFCTPFDFWWSLIMLPPLQTLFPPLHLYSLLSCKLRFWWSYCFCSLFSCTAYIWEALKLHIQQPLHPSITATITLGSTKHTTRSKIESVGSSSRVRFFFYSSGPSHRFKLDVPGSLI